MVRIEILKTSDEAKKEEEERMKSSRCPECNRFKFFRTKIVNRGIYGVWHSAYEYKCRCGCCWRVVE